MKIAVVTDDMKSISDHFGHAQYYLVFSVENGKTTEKELRLKANDSRFLGQDQVNVKRELINTDQPSTIKHSDMMGTIIDCDVLLVRGMDRGAYDALKIRSIQPIITDIQDVLAAVNAYLAGDIIDHPERLYSVFNDSPSDLTK